MTGKSDGGALTTARRLLADATGCEISQIEDQASIGTFDPWDSLAHMRLILAIEAETGAQIAPETVVDLASLQDVATLLANQQERA